MGKPYYWARAYLDPRTNSEGFLKFCRILDTTQPLFTCSNLTIETLEQGVKYVQS